MSTVMLSRLVTVNASADTVFSSITDWSRQSEWMIGTTVKGADQLGLGVGGTILARTSIGILGFNDPMTITQWAPP